VRFYQEVNIFCSEAPACTRAALLLTYRHSVLAEKVFSAVCNTKLDSPV